MAAFDKYRAAYPGSSDWSIVEDLARANNLDPEKFGEHYGIKPPSFTQELVNAVPRGLGHMEAGVGQIASDLGWEDNFIQRHAKRVIERNPTEINSLEDIANHPGAAFGAATGNLLSFIGPQLGVRALGAGVARYGLARTGAAIGQGAGQTVTAGLPSYASVREGQIAGGSDEWYDPVVAGITGVTVGALENRLGLQRQMGLGNAALRAERDVVGEFGRTPWRTAVGTTARTAGGEGLEEIPQNVVEQLGSYRDPTTRAALEETAMGGVMGVMGGGGPGAIAGTYRAAQHRALIPHIDPDKPTDLLAALGNRDYERAQTENAEWMGPQRFAPGLMARIPPAPPPPPPEAVTPSGGVPALLGGTGQVAPQPAVEPTAQGNIPALLGGTGAVQPPAPAAPQPSALDQGLAASGVQQVETSPARAASQQILAGTGMQQVETGRPLTTRDRGFGRRTAAAEPTTGAEPGTIQTGTVHRNKHEALVAVAAAAANGGITPAQHESIVNAVSSRTSHIEIGNRLNAALKENASGKGDNGKAVSTGGQGVGQVSGAKTGVGKGPAETPQALPAQDTGAQEGVTGALDEVAAATQEKKGGKPDRYQEALGVVRATKRASTSLLQKEMKTGYNEAKALIDRMEKEGVVSPLDKKNRRAVLKLPEPTRTPEETAREETAEKGAVADPQMAAEVASHVGETTGRVALGPRVTRALARYALQRGDKVTPLNDKGERIKLPEAEQKRLGRVGDLLRQAQSIYDELSSKEGAMVPSVEHTDAKGQPIAGKMQEAGSVSQRASITKTFQPGKKSPNPNAGKHQFDVRSQEILDLREELQETLSALEGEVGAKTVDSIVAQAKGLHLAKPAEIGKFKREVTADVNLSVPWAKYKDGAYLSPTRGGEVGARPTRLSEEQEKRMGEFAPENQPLVAAAEKGHKLYGVGRLHTGIQGILARFMQHGTGMEKTLASALHRIFSRQGERIPAVKFQSQEEMRETEARLTPNDLTPAGELVHGFFNPGTNTIYLPRPETIGEGEAAQEAGATPETTIHETLHAALQWFIDTHPEHPAVRNLGKILDRLIDETYTPKDVGQGFAQVMEAIKATRGGKQVMGAKASTKQVGELVSYALTHRGFGDVLSTLAQSDLPQMRVTSLFKDLSAFWDGIRNLLHFFLGGKTHEGQLINGNLATEIVNNAAFILSESSDYEVPATVDTAAATETAAEAPAAETVTPPAPAAPATGTRAARGAGRAAGGGGAVAPAPAAVTPAAPAAPAAVTGATEHRVATDDGELATLTITRKNGEVTSVKMLVDGAKRPYTFGKMGTKTDEEVIQELIDQELVAGTVSDTLETPAAAVEPAAAPPAAPETPPPAPVVAKPPRTRAKKPPAAPKAAPETAPAAPAGKIAVGNTVIYDKKQYEVTGVMKTGKVVLKGQGKTGLSVYAEDVEKVEPPMRAAVVSTELTPEQRLQPMGTAAALAMGQAKPVPAAIMIQNVRGKANKLLRNEGLANPNGAKVLKQVMDLIIETGPPEVHALAAEIRELLPDRGIILKVDTKTRAPGTPHGHVKFTAARAVDLTLFTADGREGLSYETVLHEAYHAAVAARYQTLGTGLARENDALPGMVAPNASPELEQFLNLWKEYRRIVDAGPQSIQAARTSKQAPSATLMISIDSAKDPDEFFTRSRTDPVFQDFLADMEYRGKTMWDHFKDWVKTIMGAEVGTKPSWLDAALLAHKQLTTAMQRDTPDFSRQTAMKNLPKGTDVKTFGNYGKPAQPVVYSRVAANGGAVNQRDLNYTATAPTKPWLEDIFRSLFGPLYDKENPWLMKKIDEWGRSFKEELGKRSPALAATLGLVYAPFNLPPYIEALIDTFKVQRHGPTTVANEFGKWLMGAKPEQIMEAFDYMDDTDKPTKLPKHIKGWVDQAAAVLERALDESSPAVQKQFRSLKPSERLTQAVQSNMVLSTGFGIQEEKVIAAKALSVVEDVIARSPVRPGGKYYPVWRTAADGSRELDKMLHEDLVQQSSDKPDLKTPYIDIGMDKAGSQVAGEPMRRMRPVTTVRGLLSEQLSIKPGERKEQDVRDVAQAIAHSFVNTVSIMASSVAARQLAEDMVTVGKAQGVVYDDEAALLKHLNEQLHEKGLPRNKMSVGIIEAGTQEAKSARMTMAMRLPGNWVQVPSSNAYGELAGKIVEGPLWSRIHDAMAAEPIINFQFYNDTMTTFKKAKTVYNPATAVTNIMSNFTLAFMNNISYKAVAQGMQLYVRYKTMPGSLSDKELEVMSEFHASGATLGDFSVTEIKKMMYDAMAEMTEVGQSNVGFISELAKWTKYENSMRQKMVQYAKRSGKNIDDIATQVYSAGDNVFRLASFISRMGELQRTMPEMPHDIMVADAGQTAKRQFLDYDIDSRAVKALRQTILPFMSWPYAFAGVFLSIAKNQPWKIATLAAAYTLLSTAVNAAMGDDDDDEDKKRRMREDKDDRTWFGAYKQTSLGKWGDKHIYFDTARWFAPTPIEFKKQPNGFMGLHSWPLALTPSNPATTLLITAAGFDPYTGKELDKDTDTAYDRMATRFSKFAGTMTPTWMGKKLGGAKPGLLGHEPSQAVHFTQLFLAPISAIDEQESRKGTELEIKREERAFDTEISGARRASRLGKIKYAEAAETIRALQERKRERIRELREQL